MRTPARLLWALALCLAAAGAAAEEYVSGDITIEDPRVRIVVQSRPGAGYMRVRNNGAAADRIVSARSPLAERVELHAHEMSGEMMRMREVSEVAVPAKGQVSFAPGGRHLMIIGLRRKIEPGDRMPLTIIFEKAGAIDIEAVVEAPGAGSGRAHHDGGSGRK